MKRFLILGLATLLLISLVSIRPATAVPDCTNPINTCTFSPDSCQPGWRCLSRQCSAEGASTYHDLCVPCQNEDCNGIPPGQTYDYASASTSVGVAKVLQTDVRVDIDNQDDGWGDDNVNLNTYSLNGCQGYVTVSCKMDVAQQPTAFIGSTSCTYDSKSALWYIFKCGSFDGSVSGTTYTARCELGSSMLTRDFTLETNPDGCQSACTAPNTWLSTAWNSWSGDISPATGQHCCGDDGGENYVFKQWYNTAWTAINGSNTTNTKRACCKSPKDCTAQSGPQAKCYTPGELLGSDSSNNDWLCSDASFYPCSAAKLCQAKEGKTCFKQGTDYLWTSPPSESGSAECTNGVNDDCDANWDYDTMDRGAPGNTPPHGDDGCPVSVTAASVSPTSVSQNGVVDVSCTSGVGDTNAIFVYRDVDKNGIYSPSVDTICDWNSPPDKWSGNNAIFYNCNVGSATGTIAFRCSVYDGGAKPYNRSYMTGTEKEVTVNVTPSSCSGYSDESSCTGGSCCWFSTLCSGNKSSDYASSLCLDSCSVTYSCVEGQCGAQCDGSTPITNGGCNMTTCTPACNAGYSWNGTDCVAYVCTGADPLNATLCTNDDTGLSADTPKSLVSSCSATKCEYTCNAGYELSGGVCVASAYSCTGPDPANARLCTNDDVGLLADTNKTLVPACSAPAGSSPKCEYTCGDGYTYNATSGQCDFVSSFCGDGAVQTPNDNGENEQCDDGGASDGDGCSATCQWESCLDFFTGPSGGTCANIATDGYDLSWDAPVGVPSWSPLTKQVLRVDENLSEVNQGCPTPGDCEVKEDALAWTNSSYQAVGVLQPGTLYYNRVAAVCTDLNGTVEWRDTVWNCLTAGSVGNGNISGFVTDADTDDVIPGAVVTVVAPPPGYQDTTGSNGGYSLVDVPSGSRYVSASKPGYLAQSVLVALLGGSVVQQNFSLSDGDCAQCADWEGRCTVECSGTGLCTASVPSACQGAKPGDSVWDPSQGSSGAYVTCCEGNELAYKVGAAEVGGCMEEVRKTTLLKRYRGGLYSIDVYTWKRCDQSS